MRRPLRVNTGNDTRGTTTLMAKSGMNLRDLPQMLDPKFALDIQNYYLDGDGGLVKRKGFDNLFTVAGGYPILMLEKYTSDLYMYAYNTTLAVYRKSTGASTVIKSDFVQAKFSGRKYGDYFFVASPKDKIGRVSQTLNYDGQTANFTAGALVGGGTSGATAIILSDADGGATGTLTIGNVQGTFQDNEALTDSAGGAAVVNGTLNFTYTVISAAPQAEVLEVIGPRLYAGGLSTDKTAVQYSEVDTGANPPFATWSNTTNASDGGKVYWRNAGAVRSIKSLGNITVVFSDDGKWGFTTDTIDSSGTLKKVDNVVVDRKDFGGARAAIVTPKGLFYANEAGIWQLLSIGQQGVPFSDQEQKTSILLGSKYFDEIDLSNADITYDMEKDSILLSCAEDSDTNNRVIVYNISQQSISRFKGWNYSRFLNDNNAIYGGRSNATKVDALFSGQDDDGDPIRTIFYQELKTGDLEQRQTLLGTYVNGEFSSSASLDVCYDIFDAKGSFVEDKLCQTWTVDADTESGGWGTIGWGGSFGTGKYINDTVDSFSGGRDFIRNFQRIRIKIESNDALDHTLKWVKLIVRKQIPIRRRNLTKQ